VKSVIRKNSIVYGFNKKGAIVSAKGNEARVDPPAIWYLNAANGTCSVRVVDSVFGIKKTAGFAGIG
jgi:hypothetical protein